tara:strand:- start:799 stop:1632 length:834 start_codon:yes stop_codon:yes gene_type:complete
MGWYNDGWIYRAPITIGNHSGVNSPEVQFTIPPAMGKFWSNTESDLSDVRITRADGVTLLKWAFDGTVSQANKTATIQVDETDHNVATLYGNQNAAASASVGMFMYWGNDSANLADGWDNSINITTTPKTGLIDLSNPGTSATVYVLKCYKPTPDQEYPSHRIRKQVNDQTLIYWDLADCVSKLRRHSELSLRDEEIAYVKTIIYDQDGNDTTTAMTDLNSIAIGQNYTVSMPIKAGTHEKRYIIIMTFGLVNGAGTLRVLDQRATLLVNNLALHTS